jgi:hypothetical protein
MVSSEILRRVPLVTSRKTPLFVVTAMKISNLTQTILFCSILTHTTSVRQNMAYWTPVQVKAAFSSELFPCTQILCVEQALVKVETEYTVLSPVNGGASQGSALDHSYTCYTLQTCNLNRIYNRNICRRNCSRS